MTQSDLRELLNPTRFNPFVVTLTDGFSIAIGEFQRQHLIAAARVFVTMTEDGDLLHVPYHAIAHIHEPQGKE